MLVVFWTCLDSGFLGFGHLAPGFWVSAGWANVGFCRVLGFGFGFEVRVWWYLACCDLVSCDFCSGVGLV